MAFLPVESSPFHPLNIKIYREVPIEKIPDTESLKDTYERVISYYKKEIEEKLINNNVLISPYFVMNLLWYPAYETLFSIIRKVSGFFS